MSLIKESLEILNENIPDISRRMKSHYKKTFEKNKEHPLYLLTMVISENKDEIKSLENDIFAKDKEIELLRATIKKKDNIIMNKVKEHAKTKMELRQQKKHSQI